jgi:enoyl-CoA hydratase
VSQIADALDDLEADASVLALVVTGAGSTFCAGAELATLQRAAGGDFSLIRQVYAGFLRILHTPLLTIAAVNGPAVGAGFNLALACDARIGADSARFISRFAELRILPGGGHTWLLSRVVGHQLATMSLLLGRTWDAATALRDGLVADVVPASQVVSAALRLGAGLDAFEREYVRRAVATLRAAPLLASHADALEMEAGHQQWSTGRSAFTEGLASIEAAIGRSSNGPSAP